MAHQSAALLLPTSKANTIADAVIVLGTDKSIPPPTITKYCPIATIPMNDASEKKMGKCDGLAKPCALSEVIPKSIAAARNDRVVAPTRGSLYAPVFNLRAITPFAPVSDDAAVRRPKR